MCVTPGEDDWSKLLKSCCGVWAAPARHRAPRCAQSTQHSHSTERTVGIQSDQRKSVWTLRVMQFDVPNPILTSQSNLPGRGAVGWSRPSPRDAGTSVGTWVGMCAAFVCNRPTGRGTRPGHACGDARTTRQSHRRTIAYAVVCVCCSRGLGLLTSPVGVESQRPEITKAFNKNSFVCVIICVISHVITSSSLPSLSPIRKLDIQSARSALGWPCAIRAAAGAGCAHQVY